MKTGRNLTIVVAGMILVLSLVIVPYAFQEVAEAWECRLIRINSGPGDSAEDLTLEPKTLWIDKGTCVIWINQARTTTPDVLIKFREGKKCEEVTESPSGFNSVEGCYVTGVLPIGGTSSLQFTEAGTFEYQIESKASIKTKGKIVVKE